MGPSFCSLSLSSSSTNWAFRDRLVLLLTVQAKKAFSTTVIEAEECSLLVPVLIVQEVLISVVIVDQRLGSEAARNAL